MEHKQGRPVQSYGKHRASLHPATLSTTKTYLIKIAEDEQEMTDRIIRPGSFLAYSVNNGWPLKWPDGSPVLISELHPTTMYAVNTGTHEVSLANVEPDSHDEWRLLNEE